MSAEIPEKDELQRLRKENAALRAQLVQMEEIGKAFEQIRHEEMAASAKVQEMQESLRRAHAVNRTELEKIAKVISRFLPHTFPSAGGLRFGCQCRPCHHFGGDIYDVVPLVDGRVAVCMADVAGHGAQAMVAMATARSLLRAALQETTAGIDAADVLLKLSHWFQNQLESDQFVTMWLGIWTPGDEMLRFASAAHPPAVLWRKGSDLEYIETQFGFPLGMAGIEPEEYVQSEFHLGVGDRVFLYTDGWNESPSRAGELLEDERFLDFLGNTFGLPVEQVCAALFMLLERHAANSRIRDDVSLLVFDRAE